MTREQTFWLVVGILALMPLLVLTGSYFGGQDYTARRTELAEQWLQVTPDGTMASDGSPVTTYFRVGTEPKTLILFCGGGISINEYTAARPYSAVEIPEGFYSDNGSVVLENLLDRGILALDETGNPFKDWNIIIIPYSTADYHIGTGDFEYTTLDGEPAVLHHRGYDNFRAIMDMAVKLIPKAEQLCIAGYSAGGFGAAMLTDDILTDYYPDAENVTLCIDSSLNLSDAWQSIAEDVWSAPEHITEKIRSSNLVVDFLGALYEEYGDRIRYLYVNSLHDGELTRYQNYIFSGEFDADNRQSKGFASMLADMADELRQVVPTVGIYVYDRLPYTRYSSQSQLTQHTILTTASAYWPLNDHTSVMSWLSAALNGDVQSHGLNLLENAEDVPAA